jgi:hypothetical protein
LALALSIGLAAAAGAQDNAPAAPPAEGQAPIASDWTGTDPFLYAAGDQTFSIDLGPVLPLFFVDGKGGTIANKLSVGGAGSLSYDYYLTPQFAVGGEFAGMFAGTLGQNMLFMMPFGVKGTYHFLAKSFEFPLSLLIGAVNSGHLGNNYFGLFVKPSAAAYYRYSADWSFGLNAAYWWAPQWMDTPETSVYGNFLELTLAARYHF